MDAMAALTTARMCLVLLISESIKSVVRRSRTLPVGWAPPFANTFMILLCMAGDMLMKAIGIAVGMPEHRDARDQFPIISREAFIRRAS